MRSLMVLVVTLLTAVTAAAAPVTPATPAAPAEGVKKREEQTGVPIGKGKVKPTVTLTSPIGGWTVDRMLKVEGAVSDITVDPIIVSINGDRYLIQTFGGRFSRSFPAAAGKNVVKASATNLGGTTTAEANVTVQAPPVPFKAVLTSDMDGVYTDLHIWEPTSASEEKLAKEGTLDVADMAHVYWANTASPSGGTFFLNSQGGDFDKPGYGPYLYIHRAPPAGLYLVATNYWPSGDKAHTLANLAFTLFEGTAQEVKRVIKVPLGAPGTTRVLAWVLLQEGSRAQIWVPSQDRPPMLDGKLWPKNLEAATAGINTQGDGGGEY